MQNMSTVSARTITNAHHPARDARLRERGSLSILLVPNARLRQRVKRWSSQRDHMRMVRYDDSMPEAERFYGFGCVSESQSASVWRDHLAEHMHSQLCVAASTLAT